MFGPDICGSAKRVHVIFTYKGVNHLVKKEIPCKEDEMTHLYTLIVSPDNTYQVKIDGEEAQKGDPLQRGRNDASLHAHRQSGQHVPSQDRRGGSAKRVSGGRLGHVAGEGDPRSGTVEAGRLGGLRHDAGPRRHQAGRLGSSGTHSRFGGVQTGRLGRRHGRRNGKRRWSTIPNIRENGSPKKSLIPPTKDPGFTRRSPIPNTRPILFSIATKTSALSDSTSGKSSPAPSSTISSSPTTRSRPKPSPRRPSKLPNSPRRR